MQGRLGGYYFVIVSHTNMKLSGKDRKVALIA